MSSSVRNAVAGFGLALAVPALGLAQPASYPKVGGEFPISGALPGDQARPALSINFSGGFMVWEDNAIDGLGLGIGAMALDSNLSPLGSRFRVDQRTGGDQERPQVAVIPGGGAAFVWQGGHQGFEHIYARFLSPSNTWLGPDLRVSTPTNDFQINPSIATLTNGNFIMVWGSHNQAYSSSMQDVYGQLFSPSGQRLGGEFLINTWMPYNQRNPSVAALANGGFVVVWISEQQRQVPTVVATQTDFFTLTGQSNTASQLPHSSVDVYGRLYSAGAFATSDEFLVNTDSKTCANPRVAASTNGGFMVTWSQRSAFDITNSWDVFALAFSNSTSASAGVVRLVNTTTFGDQFLPQVAALGTDYFVIWSSLGQENATEGVYGQFLANDGTPSGTEFRVNTTLGTAMRLRMHPTVASDNYGRFLTVWSRLVVGPSSVDLYSQIFGSTPPSAAAVYRAPSSDPFAADPTVEFDPPPQNGGGPAGFVGSRHWMLDYPAIISGIPTNPVAPAKGTYAGLFCDTNGVTPLSAGYFVASTTDRGTYSARVVLGKKTYGFSGRFDDSGAVFKVVSRGQWLTPLKVRFQAADDQNQLLGTISAGNWSATLVANLQTVTKSSGLSAQPGTYTFIVPPDTSTNSIGPGGFGFGTLKLDAVGNVKWSATLADGTKLVQKTSVSRDGVWPLYASLYSGGGSIIGWLQFTNQSDSDFGGQTIWMKPRGAGGKNFPFGFTNAVWSAGSVYTSPGPGGLPMKLGSGAATLICAGAGPAFTNTITWDAHNRATTADGTKMPLSFTAAQGVFKGTTVNPVNRRTISFQGAFFQDGTNGFGYYLTPNQSGWIYLSPTQ